MKKLLFYILFMLPMLATAHEAATDLPFTAKPTKVSKSPKGMIVVGTRPNVRAFEPFIGNISNGERYTSIINRYADALQSRVKIYMMIIPTQAAFYTPDTVSHWSRPQQPTIKAMYSVANEKITTVDAYSALLPHVNEPIYLRTDHHWAPLAAYYAAEAFAKAADVPFRDLSCFEPDTVHNFIGTMNRFSGNNACTGSPEEFVFYRPKDTNTTASFIRYRLANNKAIGENPMTEEDFFRKIKDGSATAYSTFMGGDACTVKVKGSIKNGRRLLLTKDSFGNALPAYLFNSFEEVHVIDPRYYTKGLLTYINNNNITDWLVTNNATFAQNKVWSNYLERLFK
ncbi:MAG: hypothetical protein HUK05_03790 [Prevotella sp.]|nr:hypothetical protein [Prevotella sp.]